MTNKLFVGGISFSSTEDSLRAAFAQFGTVVSVKIIVDKFTGRSKGFAFVEMSSADEANKAMDALNNTELDGRVIKVSEARPQEPRNNYNNSQM